MSARFTNPLTALLAAVEARLQADSVFATSPPVPILTERLSDLSSAVEKAIGKIGLCLILATPKLEPINQQQLTRVTLTIGAFENPVINQGRNASRLPAADAAINAWACLDKWSPGPTWSPFTFISQELISADPILIYEATLHTVTQLTIT